MKNEWQKIIILIILKNLEIKKVHFINLKYYIDML